MAGWFVGRQQADRSESVVAASVGATAQPSSAQLERLRPLLYDRADFPVAVAATRV